VESIAEVFGEFVQLVISIDLNGLLGGVHDHVAFVAPMKVFVQFHSQVLSEPAIEIIGQLF